MSAWIGGVQRTAVTAAAPSPAAARAPDPETRSGTTRRSSGDSKGPRVRKPDEVPKADAPRAVSGRPTRPSRKSRPGRADSSAAATSLPQAKTQQARKPADALKPRSATLTDPDSRREAELEDSILSAIADAVDVLAEDRPNVAARKRSERPVSEAKAPPVGDTKPPLLDRAGEDRDPQAIEIGDEIQRILASYTANC